MSVTYMSVLATPGGGGGAPVEGLAITTPASKLTFNVGESFNSNGLVVTGEVGGLTGDVTSECTITPPTSGPFTIADVGDHSVLIDYYGTVISYSIHVRDGIEIGPWATATDAQLIEMLDAHYRGEIDLHGAEGWEIGAEREVALSAVAANAGGYDLEAHDATTVKMVLMQEGGKKLASDGTTDCAFIVGFKGTYATDSWHLENGMIGDPQVVMQTRRWSSGVRRDWLNTVFKDSITSSDFRGLFKQFVNTECYTNPDTYDVTVYNINDYFSFPSLYEIFGSWSVGGATASDCGDSQFEYYKTPANRIKWETTTVNPDKVAYWTRSIGQTSAYYFCVATKEGSGITSWCNNTFGISPFGVI